MKFRYKVLFTNLILLSLGLGLVGYLMIHKNFELAKQTQLKNAIVQNNLVQSSVEYELLQLLNSVSDNSETLNNNTDNNNAEKSSISASSIAAQLPQIGSRVSSSVRSSDSFFYIYFDGEKVYTDDKSDARIMVSVVRQRMVIVALRQERIGMEGVYEENSIRQQL